MKKLYVLPILILVLSVFLSACGSSKSSGKETAETGKQTVTIAAVDYEPYDKIIELVQKNLKKEGINLEVKYFSDVVIPNQALQNKEVDLNYFQHQSYLDGATQANGWKLVAVAKTFNNIFGAYSKKYKSIEELPDRCDNHHSG